MHFAAALRRSTRRRSEHSIKLQVPRNNFTLPSSSDNWCPDIQLPTKAESKAGMETTPQSSSPEVCSFYLIGKVEAIVGNVMAFTNRESAGITF